MIEGVVAAGFEPVREVFAANFERAEDYREIGAALAVYRNGELVVDLWGGFADRGRTRPWTRGTMVNLWSTTKGVAALCVASLVDRGALGYADRVADHWPDFAAAGKADVTVAELLSHQAGLPGFAEPIALEALYDQPACAARLGAQAPIWEPGTANGYHAVTWGVLVAELVRRVDGRTIGRILSEELAGPLRADIHLGLPSPIDSSIADILPPDREVDLSALEMTPAMVMALASPRLDPVRANDAAWRAAELPALNGHGSAVGVARLYAAALSGESFSAETLAEMTKVAADRVDLVLGFNPHWAMGVLVNGARVFGPAPDAFGHGGWGGSLGCADRESGIAMGYVLNHMGPELVGDPRTSALCDAVFEAARAA